MNIKTVLSKIGNSEFLKGFGSPTIGADIETFIIDKYELVVPASERISGSKKHPTKLNDGVIAHPDNISLEFGFNPADNALDFALNISDAIQQVDHYCGTEDGNVIAYVPEVDISEQYAELLEDESFREVGCDPFITLYDKKVCKYDWRDLGEFRYGSGHVHIGYDHLNVKPNKDLNKSIVQNMDFFYAGFMERSYLDKESEQRMNKYGMLGSFRHKPYGLEYRTPSNVWVGLELHMEMFELASLSALLALGGIVVDVSVSKQARDLPMEFMKNEVDKIKEQLNGKENKVKEPNVPREFNERD